jgi:hypothetical protein
MKKINIFLLLLLSLSIYFFYKIILVLIINNSLQNYLLFFVILFYIFVIIYFLLQNDSKKQKFFLVSISFFFTLVIVEKLLFFFIPQSITDNDKYNYYKKKLSQDKNYFVAIQPNNIDYDKFNLQPLGSKSYSKTIHCNEIGFYSEYFSDRYGFNNTDKIWEQNTIDYLLIGDSYVHGACVNPENNISGIIFKKTKKNILNLGFSSNGPLMEFATLKEYNLKKKIKNLIWVYYEGNDMYDLQNELNNKILINYLNNKNYTQNLTSNQKLIDDIFDEKLEYELKYFTTNKNNNVYSLDFHNIYKLLSILFKKKKIDNETYQYFNKIIFELKKFCKENDILLTFVYLPDFYNFDSYDKKVFQILNELNINYIDLRKEINKKQISDMLPQINPGHFNKNGYYKITEIILNNLY